MQIPRHFIYRTWTSVDFSNFSNHRDSWNQPLASQPRDNCIGEAIKGADAFDIMWFWVGARLFWEIGGKKDNWWGGIHTNLLLFLPSFFFPFLLPPSPFQPADMYCEHMVFRIHLPIFVISTDVEIQGEKRAEKETIISMENLSVWLVAGGVTSK